MADILVGSIRVWRVDGHTGSAYVQPNAWGRWSFGLHSRTSWGFDFEIGYPEVQLAYIDADGPDYSLLLLRDANLWGLLENRGSPAEAILDALLECGDLPAVVRGWVENGLTIESGR